MQAGRLRHIVLPKLFVAEPLELCFDGFDDGFEVRKLAGLLLGKQFLSIDADFEDAAARRHKLQRTETLFELQELDRQTDGLWLIVSSGAIFDRNFRIHLHE